MDNHQQTVYDNFGQILAVPNHSFWTSDNNKVKTGAKTVTKNTAQNIKTNRLDLVVLVPVLVLACLVPVSVLDLTLFIKNR